MMTFSELAQQAIEDVREMARNTCPVLAIATVVLAMTAVTVMLLLTGCAPGRSLDYPHQPTRVWMHQFAGYWEKDVTLYPVYDSPKAIKNACEAITGNRSRACVACIDTDKQEPFCAMFLPNNPSQRLVEHEEAHAYYLTHQLPDDNHGFYRGH